MQRRKFIQSAMFTIGAMSLAKSGFSGVLADPAWKIKMLNDKIGIFTEQGGIIGFHLSKEGITVVDAQFPNTAPHLIDELKKKGIPFRLLINTHHHYDHTAGNISFKPLVSRLIAHENSLVNQRRVAEDQHKTELQYFPTETYNDGWSERAGTDTISMHYYGPAHTNGDSVIHFEENKIAHVGDLVFNRKYPYIDRSAGASIKNWIITLQKIQTHYPDDTIFICGHAGDGYPVVGDKAMVNRFQKYLTAASSYVETAMLAGRSKDDILKTTSFPGFEDWKGDGIERTLTAAYEEIAER